MSPHRLVMAVFFLQPFVMGAWIPRIPQVQSALGLDHATLALALIGMPVGTLFALPVGGQLVTRFGARKIIIWGFVAYLIAVCFPVWAWDLLSLFLALAFAGASIAILELGLNVEADSVEKSSGKMIMSTCHGFWSLGMMTGSLIGAGQAFIGLAPALSLPILSVIMAVPCLWVAVSMPKPLPSAEDEAPKGPRFVMPHPILLGVCLFAFGITMSEGAAADWSAIFLRDMFAAGPAIAGLGYSVFALMVSVGRFSGDYARKAIGPVMLARICAVLALIGVTILYFAPSTTIAMIGFGFLGVGVSVGFPLGVTAAASAPGRSPAVNVATLSFIALAGFLVGPPFIGFVAEATNIRIGLTLLVPMLLVSLGLTVLLKPRPIAQTTVRTTAAE